MEIITVSVFRGDFSFIFLEDLFWKVNVEPDVEDLICIKLKSLFWMEGIKGLSLVSKSSSTL